MKRLLTVTAIIALFASAAFAGVQDFEKFTVDVPEGWTATQDGPTVVMVKNDNTASMSITVDTIASTECASLKEVADAFVGALNGKNLKVEDGTYQFEMTNANGVDSKAILSGDEKNYALFVMTGIENASEEMSKILDSVKEK